MEISGTFVYLSFLLTQRMLNTYLANSFLEESKYKKVGVLPI